MKALFLYTELAPYVVACLNRLAAGHGVEVHVVRWPVNPEAPFKLRFNRGVVVYERNSMDDQQLMDLAESLDLDATFVSGWVDKGYLRVARRLRREDRRVVLCSDTAWRGDMRQWVAVAAGRLLFPGLFSHAWVTGKEQRRYAQRLGFAARNVSTGYYAADTAPFIERGERTLKLRNGHWPRRLLTVGRYIPSKCQQLLCDAFAELCEQGKAGDWTLTLVGTGEDFQRVSLSPSGLHPRIHHMGFVGPDSLPDVVADHGAFILPSAYEPWGVVVHEQACSAQPLLLSSAIGARQRFLKEGVNGFGFKANDKASLKQAIQRLVATDAKHLYAMGEASLRMGRRWGPNEWAKEAIRLMGPAR